MTRRSYAKGEYRRTILRCEKCRRRYSQFDALMYGGKCSCGGSIVSKDEFYK